MLPILFTMIFAVINHCAAYYLSLSEIKWQNASNYCQKHCNSELASIHSAEDYQKIIQLLQYYKSHIVSDISIGLNNISGQGWKWTDVSPFNYGNVAVGTYPWRTNRPKGEHVVVLEKDTFEFQDVGLNGRRHFLCNDCDGVITKYILPNLADSGYTQYNESQRYCRATFGTTLATLHSFTDMQEAQIICAERTNSNGCWIGIFDEFGDFNFKQDDGTSFDYGNQLNTNGVFPWSPGQPLHLQNNIPHCVILATNTNYLWNGNTSCIQPVPKTMCNVPSEICYESEWQVIYGSNDWHFVDNPCQLTHADMSHSLTKLYRKQWSITSLSNNKLIIEFMFTIVTGTELAEAGLYLFTSTSQDYYIGIQRQYNINNIFLKASNNPSQYATTLGNAILNGDYNNQTYYTLTIEIFKNIMNISFNNTQYLSYDEMSTNQNISIAIQHMECMIYVKSLYVSGTPHFDFNASTTLIPSLAPTIATNMPTPSPSYLPVCHRDLKHCSSGATVGRNRYNNCEWYPCPTAAPTFVCMQAQSTVIIITFDYTLQHNTSSTQIENVVTNITNSLLEKDIHGISNCNITNYYSDINIIKDNTADIEMLICYICDDKITLNVAAIQNLTTDFIQNVDDSTLLLVVPGSTVITVNEKEMFETTTFIMTQKTEQKTTKTSVFWPIMVTVFVLLCICIVIFGICIAKKIRDENKVDNKNDGIALSIAGNPGLATNQTNIISDDMNDETDKTEIDNADIIGDINTITEGNDSNSDIIIDDRNDVTLGMNDTGESYNDRAGGGYTPIANNFKANSNNNNNKKMDIALEMRNSKNNYNKIENEGNSNELIIEDDLPTNDSNTIKDDEIIIIGSVDEINTKGSLL